ncbi:hypothetical protein [Variovorax sp. YR216]|uniref:hypothetical protein n=1 Tax=Variovorax sp. YR216 TaxID=1882828 RepID=UPI00089BC6BF|nr:hypothetical protein [Variovorax sp. YR216]SEB15450.1 hypothetical protein SAMN05444680_11011 [Variovorax sp. YR216]
MEATQSLGTFNRFFKELMAFLNRPVFAKSAPARRHAARPARPVEAKAVASPAVAAKAVAPLAVASIKVDQVEKPVTVAIPQRAAAPVVDQPVVAPAVKAQVPEDKPMRTLAEVRADLARLREKSRERQAQQRAAVRHDVTFPATDFMEYLPSVPESRAEKQDDAGESFAPTAYLDFTVLKPR